MARKPAEKGSALTSGQGYVPAAWVYDAIDALQANLPQQALELLHVALDYTTAVPEQQPLFHARARCPVCQAGFRWPGERDQHMFINHPDHALTVG